MKSKRYEKVSKYNIKTQIFVSSKDAFYLGFIDTIQHRNK